MPDPRPTPPVVTAKDDPDDPAKEQRAAVLEIINKAGDVPRETLAEVLAFAFWLREKRIYLEGQAAARAEGAADLMTLLDCDDGPCAVVGGMVYVNCNDAFAYATAEGQLVEPAQFHEVAEAHRADPTYGALLWAQRQRGGQAFLPELQAKIDGRPRS